MTELRRALDEAVIAGGTDARDICHQLSASQELPDGLTTKLASTLKSKGML